MFGVLYSDAIEEHSQDDTYYPTQAAIKAKQVLDENQIVIITGIIGSGKTKTALEVARRWLSDQKNGAQCIVMTSRTELEKNMRKHMENICFVLDDCISMWTLESTHSSVATFFVGISELVNKGLNIKLILTIDIVLFRRNRTMLQHYDVFQDAHIIDVSETSLSSEYEKRCILRKHVEDKQARMSHYVDVDNGSTTRKEISPTSTIELMNISIHTLAVGFPSMCSMFANIPEFRKQEEKFFQYCDLRIGSELQNRRKGSLSDQRVMCCISYAMLRNRVLDLDNIDLELFGKMWKRFGIKEDKDEATCIIDTTKKLKDSYFCQRPIKKFVLQHTAVYNSCMKNWFNKRPHLLIELCSVDIIKDNLRGEKYPTESGEPVFLMKDDTLRRHLAQRFVTLLPSYPELESHPLMKDGNFCSLVEEKRNSGSLVVYEDIENYE